MGKKLKTDFIDPAGEDRTPEEAIKFCLRIRNGNDDEEFYVKTLVNMYESLEEFTSFIEPVPVPEEWVCSYGHHNLENHCFCSVCGEKEDGNVKAVVIIITIKLGFVQSVEREHQ